MRNDYEYCPCCQGSLERLYLDEMDFGTEFCLDCGWEQGQKIIDVEYFFKALSKYENKQ